MSGCVRVWVRAWVRACVSVCMYHNNIWTKNHCLNISENGVCVYFVIFSLVN